MAAGGLMVTSPYRMGPFYEYRSTITGLDSTSYQQKLLDIPEYCK